MKTLLGAKPELNRFVQHRPREDARSATNLIALSGTAHSPNLRVTRRLYGLAPKFFTLRRVSLVQDRNWPIPALAYPGEPPYAPGRRSIGTAFQN
jgi:hypothetical protein